MLIITCDIILITCCKRSGSFSVLKFFVLLVIMVFIFKPGVQHADMYVFSPHDVTISVDMYLDLHCLCVFVAFGI